MRRILTRADEWFDPTPLAWLRRLAWRCGSLSCRALLRAASAERGRPCCGLQMRGSTLSQRKPQGPPDVATRKAKIQEPIFVKFQQAIHLHPAHDFADTPSCHASKFRYRTSDEERQTA